MHRIFSFTCLLGLLVGCQATFQPIKVGTSFLEVRDSSAIGLADSLVAPYRQALLEATMEPLIYSPSVLQKAQPESALGNLLADLLLEESQQLFGEVHMGMLNYGGVRAGLPADTIRTGHILEVLPFANNLHLVEMDSALLQEFLNHWAQKGGTPVAGVRFEIAQEQAVAVRVGKEPLQGDKIYRVVMPDYVANGGDGCGFLSRAKHQESSGHVLSDLIIHALRKRAAAQPQLQVETDGRIKRR